MIDSDLLILLLLIISAHNNRRNSYHLLRKSLLLPSRSPWIRLLESKDDGSFLTLTGLSFTAFKMLSEIINKHDIYDPSPIKVGRPHCLNSCGRLGLLLFYLNSTMGVKHLCMIFGVTIPTAWRVIYITLGLLIQILEVRPDSQVIFPNDDELKYFSLLIHNREKRVNDVALFADGLALLVHCCDDLLVQNSFYNGYKSDTTINNVFLFAPTGKIVYCAINAPGSWHDSQVACGMINTCLNKLGIYKVCVDKGFPKTGLLQDRFVGPIGKKTMATFSNIVKREMKRRSNIYTSLRQASEWGMRALQGTFSRLKTRLTSNKYLRKAILYAITLLTNFRITYVGFNQIKTVFNPEYIRLYNITGYDRIARYYYDLDD